MAKVLLWDIEAADLNADYGHILCIGYKWLGSNTTYVISRTEEDDWPTAGKNLWDDRRIIREFLPVMAQADNQVTWYGKKFDEPYVRARMMYWGFKNDFPPIFHTDLYYTARFEMKLSNNRLATVGNFLKLEEGKMHMPVTDWKHAAMGDRAKMLKTERRCGSDVVLLEEAYVKMRPFIRSNRFNMRVLSDGSMACPACGSDKLQRRGYRFTLNTKWRRFQCQKCGAWSSSPLTGRGHGTR